MSLKPIPISIVNYTNTLPFKWALKRHRFQPEIDLQEDIPSICAQKLKYNQVQLALVPVALLPELDNYHIESDYCIGANGKVDSVKLYSQVPLADIRTIVLDYHSRSSITLTRVLCRFFWKLAPDFVDAKPGFENEVKDQTAAVVIGDRTFKLNGTFAYEYDLAEEWKSVTGLPFVFAAWVSTAKLPEEFIRQFNSALKYGLDHIPEAVAEDHTEQGLSKEQTIHYLTQRIDYALDAEKRKALALFMDYIRKL